MGMGIDNGMAVMKMKRDDILAAVKANLVKHKETYERAVALYREALIVTLTEKLAAARDGKVVSHTIDLVQPKSHEKDYARIIRMLEMTVLDELFVTEEDFSKYVLDEWSWKREFRESTSRYLGG